jgi:hypothetical protein
MANKSRPKPAIQLSRLAVARRSVLAQLLSLIGTTVRRRTSAVVELEHQKLSHPAAVIEMAV